MFGGADVEENAPRRTVHFRTRGMLKTKRVRQHPPPLFERHGKRSCVSAMLRVTARRGAQAHLTCARSARANARAGSSAEDAKRERGARRAQRREFCKRRCGARKGPTASRWRDARQTPAAAASPDGGSAMRGARCAPLRDVPPRSAQARPRHNAARCRCSGAQAEQASRKHCRQRGACRGEVCT